MDANLFDNSVRFEVKTDNLNIKTTCYESVKIPDYKGSVYKMLTSSQSAGITDVKVKDNKIYIEGVVNVLAMYETEEGEFESLTIPAAFNVSSDFDYPEGAYNHMYNANVEDVELKTMKNRKIEAECVVNISGLSTVGIESKTFDSANIAGEMMYKHEDIEHTKTTTHSEEKLVRDSIFAGEAAGDLEVVSINCYLADISHSLSNVGILYNAAIKGIIVCFLEKENIYRSFPIDMPFNCFIERSALSNIDYYNVFSSIISKNAEIDINAEECYINVEIAIKTTAYMFQTVKSRVLTDAFVKAVKTTAEYEKQKAFLVKSKDIKSVQLNKEIILPNATKTLLFNSAELSAEPYEANGQMKYSGAANVCSVFTSYSDDEKYIVSEEKLDFDLSLDIMGDSYYVYPQITAADIKYSSSSIIINLTVDVLVISFEESDVKVVQNISPMVSELRCQDTYDIIIHYVQPDEELWDIAKKYLSSPEQIMADNNIKSKEEIKNYTPLIIS